jgi:hypothetical protein
VPVTPLLPVLRRPTAASILLEAPVPVPVPPLLLLL